MPRRSVAFALYFDAALENQVLELWNAVARRKISSALIESGARPHLCLCAASADDDVELPKLRATLESFAAQEGPLAISFATVGGFLGGAAGSGGDDHSVLFLAPPPTIQLLAFHDRFYDLLQVMGVESAESFQPGRWLPHCPLVARDLLPKNRLADAFAVFRELKLPLAGHICDVGLVELDPFKEYFSFSLEGEI